MGPTGSLRELAAPIVGRFGLELWDVEVGGGTVRILVDRPDGLDVEVLADASHALSAALDDRDDLTPAGRYTLEVSSPGVERTLRTPAQFGRFVGSEVNVKLSAPVNGTRRLRGTLVAADDRGIRVSAGEAAAGDAAVIELGYAQIERARTVLVWGPAPKPGSPSRGRRRPVAAPAGGSVTNPKDAQ